MRNSIKFFILSKHPHLFRKKDSLHLSKWTSIFSLIWSHAINILTRDYIYARAQKVNFRPLQGISNTNDDATLVEFNLLIRSMRIWNNITVLSPRCIVPHFFVYILYNFHFMCTFSPSIIAKCNMMEEKAPYLGRTRSRRCKIWEFKVSVNPLHHSYTAGYHLIRSQFSYLK
jgi:hypothetical protein